MSAEPLPPLPLPFETRLRTLAEIERDYIEAVIRATGGRMAAAAAILGLDPSTLYRKRVKYGITTRPQRSN